MVSPVSAKAEVAALPLSVSGFDNLSVFTYSTIGLRAIISVSFALCCVLLWLSVSASSGTWLSKTVSDSFT